MQTFAEIEKKKCKSQTYDQEKWGKPNGRDACVSLTYTSKNNSYATLSRVLACVHLSAQFEKATCLAFGLGASVARRRQQHSIVNLPSSVFLHWTKYSADKIKMCVSWIKTNHNTYIWKIIRFDWSIHKWKQKCCI